MIEEVTHTMRPEQVALPMTVPGAMPVTLIVYGWNNVEPGTLFWVFPSLSAALAAVRTMTNAVHWAVVSGAREEVDVERERESGAVLVEQPG
jgi:hypothetical protein